MANYISILDAANKAKDLTKVQTGKLCTDAKSFVISAALGEEEFEADEGESKFTVSSLIGEWAVFLPAA